MHVEVRLFGAPAVLTPGGERLLAPRRPDQLVALLACRPHGVTRAELAELFWPDRREGSARANLRVLLQRTQAEFGGLDLQGERVRWPVASDLSRFEAACAAGRDEEVLALYLPPLLDGLEPGLPEPLLDWLDRERQRLDGVWRSVVQRQRTGAPSTSARAAALGQDLEARHPGSLAAEQVLAAAAGLEDPEAFVGRRAERAEIVRRLQGGTRAVVVLGPGGIGKSALLRVVLADLAASAPAQRVADTTCLATLADLASLALVPARIALKLGVSLRSVGDPWDPLAAAIGHRSLLLALDNVEHLDGIDERLASLLAACDGLRLLVGSRRRLQGVGVALPLEGLPVPDEDDPGDLAELRRFDAVVLFEARARAVRPEVDLSGHVAALRTLLRATEGLPLGLELAAAATRLMPLDEVAAELNRSLQVLEIPQGSPRGLVACFDRSWALLDDAARSGLSRLAWLPGPFSRWMAEQVAGVPLAGLARLLDGSLLRADRRGRLSLHPLLRQFVLSRHPPANPEALASRHADHVDHLLAGVEAPQRLRSAPTLAMLDDELPHVRAAWAWTSRSTSGLASARLARLARQMGVYHVARGGAQDILPWLAHVVQTLAVPGRAGLSARAVTLRTQAMLEYHRGELDAAQQQARQALRWAIQAGDADTALSCLTVLGNVAVFKGQCDEARRHFEQAYHKGLARGDLALASAAANGLGLVERTEGRLDTARAHFQEAGRLAGQLGDVGSQVVMLINVGNLQMEAGQWAEARHTNEQALALVDSAGQQGRRAILCTILGEIALEEGDPETAGRHAEGALAALPQCVDAVVPTQARLLRARVDLAQGRPDRAAAALADGLAAARASGSSTMQLSALNAVASLWAALGAAAEAARLWSYVGRHAASTASVRALARRELARLGVAEPEPPAALALEALLDALEPRLRGHALIRS